jgi:hypothetical protein
MQPYIGKASGPCAKREGSWAELNITAGPTEKEPTLTVFDHASDGGVAVLFRHILESDGTYETL